jgi:hypothetical protein
MPIFMIGTQRSGSNLLRLMLNQLPEIAAPHPPHFIQRLLPFESGYGDLSNDKNFMQMVDDVCKLVELNPVPWEVTLDRKDIASRCRSRSIVAAGGAAYDVMAEHVKADTWCCKSLANINYLDEIEAYYGDEARYIYLYRDGRDVALSFRKALVGEKSLYHIAKEWDATQRAAVTKRKHIGTKRFFSVSYESLTGTPEKATRDLCDCLGATYTDSMLEFHESDDAKSAAGASYIWGNVAKPLMTDNSNKFLREMSADDVRLFELVAGDSLDALGYKRFQTQVGETRAFSTDEIRQFESENQLLKQDVLSKVDAEDMKRRDLQDAHLKAIQDRQANNATVSA